VVDSQDASVARELPGCPTGVSCEQAARDFEKATELRARAGEIPAKEESNIYLPLFERAAYSGYLPAQIRFGKYVVGYWYTDEAFWPHERRIAVAALAMLRVAAKRSPDTKDRLMRVLAKDPVKFTESDGVPALPAAWVKAALVEAAHWEKAHPDVVRPNP
jgi:hypothetical protein